MLNPKKELNAINEQASLMKLKANVSIRVNPDVRSGNPSLYFHWHER